MRCVVTGGAGFIGSHLVDHLVGAGHEVVVVDDFTTGRRENLASSLDRIALVEGSVADYDLCTRALADADLVFHQAALPSVPRSVRDPWATHEANASGTLNVLRAAHERRARRVVYAASSSAYGDTPELPKREEMVPLPLSPYAASKLAGETYCRVFTRTYGLETVALRYFNVFGPRQDPESEYAAVIPKFLSAALAGRAPTIFGDGSQTRDFTYVSNVVRANMLAALAGPDALGRVFNVGAGEQTSLNELWRRIEALTGVRLAPRREPDRAGDVRHSVASLDNARATLGYTAEVGLDEGLERTLAALSSTASARPG